MLSIHCSVRRVCRNLVQNNQSDIIEIEADKRIFCIYRLHPGAASRMPPCLFKHTARLGPEMSFKPSMICQFLDAIASPSTYPCQ